MQSLYATRNVSSSAHCRVHDFCAGLLDHTCALLVVGRGVRLDLRDGAVAGWLLVAAGAALYLTVLSGALRYVAKELQRLSIRQKVGRGGPYRIVRNPMYWSVACVMLGEALAFRSVALAEIGCVFFACARYL